MMKVFLPRNSAMLLNRPYPREPVFKPFFSTPLKFSTHHSILYHLGFASLSISLITIRDHRWHSFQTQSYPTTHTLPDLSAWDRVSWVHLPSPPNHGYLLGPEWFQILFLVSFNRSVSFPLPSNVSISPECEASLLPSFSLNQPVYCLFFLIAQV